MNSRRQNSRFNIRDWSIHTRLLFGFGLIILFVVGLALVNFFSFLTIQKSVNKALVEGLQIRDFGNRIQNDLITARRQEQAFLLRWQEEGYENAINTYIIPHGNAITDIRQTIEKLNNLTAGQEYPLFTHITPGLSELSAAINTYRNEFNAVINLLGERGTEGSGIIGELESAEQALLSEIYTHAQAHPELLSPALKLQLSEKKYRVYGKQTDLKDTDLALKQIRSALTDWNESEAQNMTLLLDRYEAALAELMRVDSEIIQHTQQYTAAAEAIQPLAFDISASGTEYANQQLSSVTKSTQQAQTILIAAAAIAVFIGGVLSIRIARQISHPIRELTRVALEIGKGNLQAEAKIQSRDEIGTLAQAFNSTSNQLFNLLRSLEQRVAERTVELETANRYNAERAARLKAIAKVNRTISSIRELKPLLLEITREISDALGHYHVGIFLIDSSGENAILSAANSIGGQRMLARGHRLQVGQMGIVGFVTASGKPRIALDVGEDAFFFNNPDLPDTRSEIALPLRVSDRIIGALDVQSTTPNAFTPDDIETLEILADQVAIAIENARLFEETRRALAEAEALQQQYLQEKWSRVLKTRKQLGYRYAVTGAAPLEEPLKLSAIQKALRAGTPVQETEPDGVASLAIPLRLRGQSIGAITVRLPNRHRWEEDEIDVAQAVADRLSLAIENARLIDETTRRSKQDRIIADLTAKLGSYMQMDNILQTAAEEISKVIRDSEVLIQIQSAPESE